MYQKKDPREAGHKSMSGQSIAPPALHCLRCASRVGLDRPCLLGVSHVHDVEHAWCVCLDCLNETDAEAAAVDKVGAAPEVKL